MPGRDHLGQVVGGLEVGEVQPARRPRRADRLVDRSMTAMTRPSLHDRDRLVPDRDAAASIPGRPPGRSAAPAWPRPGTAGRRAGRTVPDDVVGKARSGPVVGPHLGQRDPAEPSRSGAHSDQVGEGQVGEQLPVGDERVQPVHVRRGQPGLSGPGRSAWASRHHRIRRACPVPRRTPGPELTQWGGRHVAAETAAATALPHYCRGAAGPLLAGNVAA